MPSHRAPQFSFDDTIESEKEIIKHLALFTKKRKKTEGIIRLLSAAVFLDKINPHLVDMLSRELKEGVTIEQFESYAKLTKEAAKVCSGGVVSTVDSISGNKADVKVVASDQEAVVSPPIAPKVEVAPKRKPNGFDRFK